MSITDNIKRKDVIRVLFLNNEKDHAEILSSVSALKKVQMEVDNVSNKLEANNMLDNYHAIIYGLSNPDSPIFSVLSHVRNEFPNKLLIAWSVDGSKKTFVEKTGDTFVYKDSIGLKGYLDLRDTILDYVNKQFVNKQF